ncbi:MAG: hypothetical protein RIC95_08395 [Vicingaceae bacterium]
MDLTERKIQLLKQIKTLENEEVLKRVEEILQQADVESNVNVSISEIVEGKTLSMEVFEEETKQWIKEQYSKSK